jgi:hypothetical protein
LTLRAVNFAVVAAPATVPAPVATGVTVLSSTSLRPAWNAVTYAPGLSGYRIFRNGLFAANVGLVLNWTDTGLTPGTAYTYNIKAVPITGNPSVFSNTVSGTTSSGTVVRRFLGGHYTTLLRGVRGAASRTSMTNRIVPGVTKGFKKRYTWRQLEPTLGNYSFNASNADTSDELTVDLAWAVTNSMILIPMIEDKTFKQGEVPTPDYMSGYSIPADNGDVFTARWAPYYVERMNALLTAMGTKFDNHPNFGGACLQETAMGSPTDAQIGAGSNPVPAGKLFPKYTVAAYKAGCIAVITHAATAFTKCKFYWGSNFIRGTGNDDYVTITEIINATKSLGHLVLWGPDVFPEYSPLITRFYPVYDTFQGQIPLCIHAQKDSYSHPDGQDPVPFYTMPQQITFAETDLHCNMMVWTYIDFLDEPNSYKYSDAITAMQANPALNTWVEP